MATRSIIAIENEDGSVTSVYCHFDGYISVNGKTLNEHYQDPNKVKALIALGSLSSLHKDLKPAEGVQHDFSNPAKNVTVAYHRDRGGDLDWGHHTSAKAFFKSDIEQYGYLFTQAGEWYVKGGKFTEPVLLTKAIEQDY